MQALCFPLNSKIRVENLESKLEIVEEGRAIEKL